MGYLWTGAILWGLFFCGGSLVARPDEHPFMLFLVGCLPIGLMVWFTVQRSTKRQAVLQSMYQEAGVAKGSGFDHVEADTGIAINKQAKTLSLLMGAFYKTYPFADIREWEAIKETPGVISAGNAAAVFDQVGVNRRAAANTGFFVSVRDVEHPKWRIAMKDEAMRARWMEILRQEINER